MTDTETGAPAAAEAETEAAVVQGRACGTCTLCCKILAIPELDKPAFQWCTHCTVGEGCTIHAERPETCRTFFCSYLVSPDLGDEWKPSKARFVLTYNRGPNRINVHVDPGRLDAWRKEPYLTQIRRWAHTAASTRGQVIVWEGPSAVAILPAGEKPLGRIPDGHLIVSAMRRTPAGSQPDILVVHGDDPRLKPPKSAPA